MNNLNDQQIIGSWHKNASAWSRAIAEKQIISRETVTNRAVIDAVMSLSPTTVLDLGCGEGWLSRELSALGVDVTGVDVVPELIAYAQARGGGDYHVMEYNDVAPEKFSGLFDAMVCNFSLLGEASVERLLSRVPVLLKKQGSCIVQTLHPMMHINGLGYKDGWRAGSWQGFGAEFSDPAAWYFRTIGSWVNLFVASNIEMVDVVEPLNPMTGEVSSIIFVGRV